MFWQFRFLYNSVLEEQLEPVSARRPPLSSEMRLASSSYPLRVFLFISHSNRSRQSLTRLELNSARTSQFFSWFLLHENGYLTNSKYKSSNF